jgi:hypothetical protein
MTTFVEAEHPRDQLGQFAEKQQSAPESGLSHVLSPAEQLRDKFHADIAEANTYYRETGDFAGFEARTQIARETWQVALREQYGNGAIEDEFRYVALKHGRVYTVLETGETVQVHSISGLYAASEDTDSPAEPLIARMRGGLIGLDTTFDDLIAQAYA